MQSADSSLSSSPTALPAPFFTCPNGPRCAAVRAREWLNLQPGAPPHFSHLRANYLIGKRDFDVGGGEFVIVLLHCLCLAREDVISRRQRMVRVSSTTFFEKSQSLFVHQDEAVLDLHALSSAKSEIKCQPQSGSATARLWTKHLP